MPFKIRKLRGKDLFSVVNANTGFKHAKGTTKDKAQRQVKLLRANEAEKGGRSTLSKRSKQI